MHMSCGMTYAMSLMHAKLKADGMSTGTVKSQVTWVKADMW